jgi:hypothetical protein
VKIFVFLLTFINFNLFSKPASLIEKKIMICGVCKNVASSLKNTIENIELLGSCFADYAVVIYENNSTDETNVILKEFAKENKRVVFISDVIPQENLMPSRTERIAKSRNFVLSLIQQQEYEGFEFVVMLDLDFSTPWPIDEICKTIQTEGDWDAVFANGLHADGSYYDRYAYRGGDYPLGPELIGMPWWDQVNLGERIYLNAYHSWVPCYSAFGGLGIYRRKSLLNVSYSGLVTEDLRGYYTEIVKNLSLNENHLKLYFQLNGEREIFNLKNPSLKFVRNTIWESPWDYTEITCCEHVPLHASMALKGHGKFYINPRMIMQY